MSDTIQSIVTDAEKQPHAEHFSSIKIEQDAKEMATMLGKFDGWISTEAAASLMRYAYRTGRLSAFEESAKRGIK